MNYRLVSRSALRVTRPTPGGGSARVVFLLVVGALAIGSVLQWRAHFIHTEDAAESARSRPPPALPNIPGTGVPLPPASYGLELAKGNEPLGSHTLKPISGGLSQAQSKRLFDFYHSAMLAERWTLASEEPPTAAGEWSQFWQLNDQVAVIQLFISPSLELTVSYCPPAPYC